MKIFSPTISGSSQASGSLTISGSLNVSQGITGSLFGTSSWALSASNAINADKAVTIDVYSFSSPVDSYLLMSNVIATTGVAVGGDTDLRYNASTNTLTAVNISATNLTGSLFGTSSWATNVLTASFAPSYLLISQTSSFVLNSQTSSFVQNSQTSSMTVLSSSFASTSSFINTLNQNVLITGSLTVGATSLGSAENTLTLGPRSTQEGGQLLLQAGTSYTSASMLDIYQDGANPYFRILRGSNVGSDAVIAQFNTHTKQMLLPAYNSPTAFTATALVGLLGFDSNGAIITTTTSSGGGGGGVTILNNTDNYLITATGTANTLNGEANLQFNGSSLTITGNITASGTITAQANGQMYFRGGDDAELWDINVANTLGVYGQQNADRAGLKLGSSGPTLFGSASRLGIGTITPTSASLTVDGNIWATSFTGSLFGTSSWAQSVSNAINSQTASFLPVATYNITASWAQSASNAINARTASFLPVGTYTITSSWATNALTASFINPLRQDVFITGAVVISGSALPELRVIGDTQFTGSINSLNGYTGSLFGTSSWATNTLTASYILNAVSSSFATTSSYALNGGVTQITAGTGISINQSTGNVTITNTGGGGGATFPYTGSAIISGSLIITGNLDTTQGGIDAIRIKETALTNAGQYDRGVTLADTWSSSGPVLTAGRIVYLSGSGQWAEAVASTTGSSIGVLGVVTTTANQNDIVLHGLVRVSQSLAGFTNGRPVYLSPLTAGTVTETPPSTSGQVGRYVGYIIDSASRQIYFNPDFTWIQL